MVEFIIQALVAASIVGAVDWVLRTPDKKVATAVSVECVVYRVSRRIHVTSVISAVICAVFAFHNYQNRNSIDEWLLMLFFGSFAVLSIYLATGSVTTDRNGINKRVFWHKTTMQWPEITEVWILQRDGGAIRLKAGMRQLTVDMRFVGRDQLLEEITAYTGLLPRHAPSDKKEGESG